MPTGRPELFQCTLEMLVLKPLTFGPMHGYGIAQHIRVVGGCTARRRRVALSGAAATRWWHHRSDAEWKRGRSPLRTLRPLRFTALDLSVDSLVYGDPTDSVRKMSLRENA